MTSDPKLDYPKASDGIVYGGILVYIAGLFLLIAFASPYWVESYEETLTQFKHMGLWEYCFDQFRFPYHQLDQLFDGCHFIYSHEYHVIREWLLPGWLISIQLFVTLSFLLSFGSQALIALVVTRYPLHFVLTYEWILSIIIFISNAITSFLLFISVWLFWTQSSRRDWLMYPNFNHLSWSYYFAVISFFIHSFASVILYKDARKSYELRQESHNLVRQMQPTHGRNGFV
ncbi:claudin superfamily protein pickel [Lycorma delicatula]|uniref:claudin superfamily protein pickel n=1 Tax=Lycorma delicatula TaxID=130591 RepID=UPI003F50F188